MSGIHCQIVYLASVGFGDPSLTQLFDQESSPGSEAWRLASCREVMP